MNDGVNRELATAVSEAQGDGAKQEAAAQRAQWAKVITERLRRTQLSLRHDQKRSMTLAGAALLFAALGPALIANRVVNERAVLTMSPPTLIVLCGAATAGLLALQAIRAWTRSRAGRDNVRPRPPQTRDFAFLVPLGIGIVLWTTGATGAGPNGSFQFGHGSIGIGIVSAAAGLLVASMYYTSKVRRDEHDLADLQFEQDLLRYDVEPFESRAEKLLSVNQIQLRRYYELNLQQARAVFFVGICCIVAGIAVVGLTFWLVYWLGSQESLVGASKPFTQMIVAVVGAVGAVMTNYVAALYFKMHASIGTSLTRFHAELAATHDLFFANVLASSVNAKSRSKTLLRMALAIAERPKPHDETPPDKPSRRKKKD